MIRRRHLLLALALATSIRPAAAHDVWLRPADPGPVAVGELVRVELWQGHLDSQEVLARNDHRLLRLEAIDPGGSATALPGLHGRTPAGVFRPASAGVWTLIYEGRPAPYSLPAARFERYLEEEGLEHVAAARRESGSQETAGRELVSRSLKSLLRVGPGPLTDRTVGLPVELIVIPGPPDAGIELLLLQDGQPAPSVLVDLQRLDAESQKIEGRTDSRGRVHFPGSTGLFLAAAVVSGPSDHPDAQWRTTFATLTFPWP